MIREIIKDQVFLSCKSSPATRADMQVVHDLLDTANANSGRCVGLAANMIGESKTILAALIGGEFIIMINPEIKNKSRQTYESNEGCLSLSGTRNTERSSVIEVEYLDKKFKRKKQIFRGLEARIIQHEMDHFDGILI
jgi:peptide deformylase